MKKVMVFAAIYFVVYLGLAFKAYTDQGQIDKIMSDPVTVNADIVDIAVQSRIKKGVEIKEYNLRYDFDIDGQSINGIFSLPESRYLDQFEETSEIEVVYRRDNPNLNMAKASIEGHKSSGTFSDKLIKLLIFAFVVALIPYGLIAVSLGWMKLK